MNISEYTFHGWQPVLKLLESRTIKVKCPSCAVAATRRWLKMKTNKGPPPMRGHSACRMADTMLVFGGSQGATLYGDLWSFHFGE